MQTKVQNYWNEQSVGPREQRAAQGERIQALETALQPLKAAFEAAKEALTSLGEDEARVNLTQRLRVRSLYTCARRHELSGTAGARLSTSVMQRLIVPGSLPTFRTAPG